MSFERQAAIPLLAFLAAVSLTYLVRRLALSSGLVDVPNARSSHARPTPRGGGAAIVLVTTAAVLLGAIRGTVDAGLGIALCVGGLAVALVGFFDDRRPVPYGLRLIIHFSAAIWAVGWLGGLPPLRVGADVVHLGLAGDALAVFGIVWALNLFNFMDGIDGIAASEALFVLLAAAWLTAQGQAAAGVLEAILALAGACAGFLVWNWPPAKIFLGDVGSGYLGFCVGVLILATTRDHPWAVWVWLTLGGVFLADATATLGRRVLSGQRMSEAHRTHAYQWLARRGRSHMKVTVGLLVVNLAVVLPLAVFATGNPSAAGMVAAGSFAALFFGCLAAGAGRPERLP